jgi:cytochrome c
MAFWEHECRLERPRNPRQSPTFEFATSVIIGSAVINGGPDMQRLEGDAVMRKLLAACSGCLMVAAASVLMLSAGTARAQDADAGKKVFNPCRACHVLDQPTNRIGPHLVGLIGRKAGSVEGFSYSDAMKNSGITWDEESLSKYLKDPKGFIAGNKMAFAGVKKDDDLKNLIAYLKEETAK